MDYEANVVLEKLVGAVQSPDVWTIVLTSVNITVSAILSVLLYCLTKRIGTQENAIQQNNLRIQMHQEYYELYDALVSDLQIINALSSQFRLCLEGKRGEILCESKSQNLLTRAKQLLPTSEYEKLEEFVEEYGSVKQNTPNMYLYSQKCNSSIKAVLLHKLIKEGMDAFLAELYDVTDNLDVDMYRKHLNRINTLVQAGFVEKIRKYSDLSDIL